MSKFEKGTSGNPAGRPPHTTTAAKLRALITDEDVRGILSAVIEQAKQGDIQASKLILDKVLPSLKSIDVQADVNEVQIPRTLADFYAMNDMVNPVDMTDDELDRIIQGG